MVKTPPNDPLWRFFPTLLKETVDLNERNIICGKIHKNRSRTLENTEGWHYESSN